MRVSRAWVLLVAVLPFWFSTGCICDTTGPDQSECSLLPTFDVRLRNLDVSGKLPIRITTGDTYDGGYELGYNESRKIQESEPGTDWGFGVVTGSGFTYRAFRADSLLRMVICTKGVPADEPMNAEVTWDGKALHCMGWE